MRLANETVGDLARRNLRYLPPYSAAVGAKKSPLRLLRSTGRHLPRIAGEYRIYINQCLNEAFGLAKSICNSPARAGEVASERAEGVANRDGGGAGSAKSARWEAQRRILYVEAELKNSERNDSVGWMYAIGPVTPNNLRLESTTTTFYLLNIPDNGHRAFKTIFIFAQLALSDNLT